MTLSPRPKLTFLPAELIARVRAGDSDALGELYARTGGALATLAHRLTGTREDAEDVLHDVFLGLPEALQHYNERGQLEAWLRRVTARVALMRIRSARRRREVDVPLNIEAGAPNEDSLALERAVNELPDALRVVLVLKMIEGYSHAEIAELLEISQRASEQRLYRAIQMLRARLDS
ncbi:MAG TPA: sigma-70 family RNA polymerase sigma factor [Gemmatimonadaceae bacterium]|nr:sigma-70 family RNA polymerase sigma factor [Gemmatimonadaceae bacterium]